MKKSIYLTCFLFTASLCLEIQAQQLDRTQSRLLPPRVVNFQQLADFEKAHPSKKKQRFIEQGEDREKEFKFTPRPIPSNAVVVAVPEPAARPGANQQFTSSPAPVTSFNGVMDNGSIIPPDIRGAAGLAKVMQTTNQEFKIYNKTGTLLNTLSMNSFFSAGGGISGSYFDPHVVYDNLRNRFVACVAGTLSSNFSGVFLAVSQTGDPLGNWYIYAIDGTGNTSDLLDFPLLGYNSDWVVITGNDFTSSGTIGKIFVMNRDSVYNGSGSVVTFVDNNAFSLAPAQTMDSTQAVEYLVQDGNGNLGSNGYIQFSTITGTPNAPVYTAGITLGINKPWSESNVGAPQSGSSNTLEDGDTRICNAIFINGSMWFSHTVFLPASSPTHDGVDWWQVDPSVPSVIQFGRIEDVNGVNFYFYPSINVNNSGDALLGFCQSSSTMFASAAYAFHAVGDPPNTMEDAFLYKAGLGSYFKTFGSGRNRWGDYTFTAVDPVNNSFWNFSQWANAGNNWGTVIANVSASNDTNCYAPINLTARNISDTSADLSWVPLSGTLGYILRYRLLNDTVWSSDTSAMTSYHITGLTGSGYYEWQVRSLCLSGDSSSFASPDTFKTHITCVVAAPTVVAPGIACAGSSVTLSASGTSVLTWFADSSGGSPLDTGTTYNTPLLAATTTYYVESDDFAPSEYAGPLDSTLGGAGAGSYTTNHNYKCLLFDCTSPVKLVTVLVYAQGASNRTITLKQNGVILRSATVLVPNGSSRLKLNFDIPVGSGFELGCQGNTGMYRNSAGAGYPYILDGVLSITGNNTGAGTYNFFYDWELQAPPCTSSRVPVTAAIQPFPVAGFSVLTAIDTATFADLSSGATGWIWTFGDPGSGSADTSILQNPVHIFSALDSAFTVCLTASDSVTGCTDTSCQTLLIGSVGLAGVSAQESIGVYPNPVKGQLTIEWSAAPAGKSWSIRISDISGRLIEQKVIGSAQHSGKAELNMGVLARGIYFLTLQSESRVLVKKIIRD